MKQAVIVSAVRTPVGKAPKGALRSARPDDLGAIAVMGALERVTALDPSQIKDVIIGCAMPQAEQGINFTRIISLRAGLPVGTSAITINRFCPSGLQAIALASERIQRAGAGAVIACGAESMSYVPMGGNKVSFNPWLVDNYPGSYLSMGLTTERVAERHGISREDSDAFYLESHTKALCALQGGEFADEPVPVSVVTAIQNGGLKPKMQEQHFTADEVPCADTSLEALA